MNLLVQMAELIQAANEINQAVETYNEAVDTAKNAAEDLASKWEGDARDAFVASQENAYSWHQKIIAVVRQMIEVIRKISEIYDQTEKTVKAIVQK